MRYTTVIEFPLLKPSFRLFLSAFYLQSYRVLNDSMLIVRDDLFLSILAFFRKGSRRKK